MSILKDVKFSFPIKNVAVLVPEPEGGWSNNSTERHVQKEQQAKLNNCEFSNYTIFDVPTVDRDGLYAAFSYRLKFKIYSLITENLLAFKGESDLLPTDKDVVEFEPHYSEVNLVDNSEETMSYRYVEDVWRTLYDAVRKKIFELRNHVYVKNEHVGKVVLTWIIYGDPVLIRYLTVNGEPSEFLTVYSTDERLKGKLFMFPWIVGIGENKTFAHVEMEDTAYWQSEEFRKNKYIMGEQFLRAKITLPILTCFNMTLKREAVTSQVPIDTSKA